MAVSKKFERARPFAVVNHDGRVLLLHEKTKRIVTSVHFSTSTDGLHFKASRKKVYISKKKGAVNLESAKHFRLSSLGDRLLLSAEIKEKDKKRTDFFISKNGEDFEFTSSLEGELSGLAVPEFTFEGKYVVYLGTPTITCAYTKDFISWQFSRALLIEPRSSFFDKSHLRIIGTWRSETHIVLLYESTYHTHSENTIAIGAAFAALDNPSKIVWRSEVPFWEAESEELWQSIGSVFEGKNIHIYFAAESGEVRTVTLPNIFIPSKKVHKRPSILSRHHGNPIIEPRTDRFWEMKATFNPAAIYADKKVHLLYRAIGGDDISVLGYASSKDGFSIEERLDDPIFTPSKTRKTEPAPLYPMTLPTYCSGGGTEGGSEDPRLTLLDNHVYLMYTAFDGWGSIRIALSSITLDHFLKKDWCWKEPMYLSPKGEIHKNWVLFPEKIDGKFAILHSISPKIAIEYVDDLSEFEAEDRVINSRYDRVSRTGSWDSSIRGSAAPPIRTDLGWLLLYHAMDHRDPNRYKLGAMILHADDPTKILYRSKKPILEPDAHYENGGWKSGVVYSCGAIVKDGELYVYYGGSDHVSCVATARLDAFLKQLVTGQEIHIETHEVVLP